MNKRISARVNAQWFIFITALLLFAALLGYQLRNDYSRALNFETTRLLSRLNIIAANIREKLETTDQALLSLRNIHGRSTTIVNAELQTLVSTMPGLRAINIVAGNGNIIASNQPELIGQNIGQQEHFRQARTSATANQLILSPPFESRPGVWRMNLSRVRLDQHGRFDGLVSATFEPDYFKSLLASINYAPDMWVGLAHDSGIRFMSVPDDGQTAGAQLKRPGSFFERHLESNQAESIHTGTSLANGPERTIALLTLIPSQPPLDHGLVIAASRETSAILSDWRNESANAALAFLLFTLIVTTLMLLFQRYQSKNSRQLKHAELDLRQREQNLHSLLDNLPARIGNWDRNLFNRFANRAYHEWFDITENAMRGMHLRAVLGDALFQTNKPFIDAALAGATQMFERDIVGKDGRTSSNLVHYIPDIRDGEVNGIYVMITDITALKASEAALRASEARFRELFENSPVAYLGHDEKGNIVDTNLRFCDLIGHPREALINRPFADFWAHEKKSSYKKMFSACTKDGKCRLELALTTASGRIVTLLLEGAVQRDLQGNFIRTHCVLHDISERKRAEVHLAESQSMLASMIDSAMDAIITVDANNRILIFNHAAEAMFGYKASAIIGKSIEQLIPKRFRHDHAQHMQKFAQTELSIARNMGSSVNREVYAQHADGHEFPIEASISHASYSGQIIYTVVVRDITELKQNASKLLELNERLEARVQERTLELARAKQQAEAASRTKSDFLANMSHEIRTPLNSVLGMTHLALQTALTPKQKDYLEKINFSGTHLLGIINDILDFSKIEAGKLELEITPFDLAKCLTQVSDLVQDTIEAKGLRLEVSISPLVPSYVYGDALRLNQILLNLVSNAIKFTSRGNIQLRISPVEGKDAAMRRFEVIDTGIGIDEAARSKLFQSFHQADTSTTRKYGGTGLGLAISKQLVELMGGEIGIQSTPGLGSTFWFKLPLPAASELNMEEFQRSEISSHHPKSLENKHILVADDHPFNQQIAEDLLSNEGALVTLANNGREVLTLLEGHHFDAILLDIQMPELDGYETARQIRLQPEFETLPIIAMTANVSATDRANCLAAGMNDFIAKPIAPHLLFNALRQQLAATDDEARLSAMGENRYSDMNTGLIDLNVLASLVGNDPERIQRFSAKFLHSMHDGLTLMGQLFEQNKPTELPAHAHRLKSVARTVGALGLGEHLETLEKGAATLTIKDIGLILDASKQLFLAIHTELYTHRIVTTPVNSPLVDEMKQITK